MKLSVYDIIGKKKSDLTLPKQFSEEVRPGLIKRAVLALQSSARVPFGSKPASGMRHSGRLSKKRRDYRGCYGHGISRVPRKIYSRRGRRMNWGGALSPGCVGGRRAHAPKSEKQWQEGINKKEKQKALRSAMAASVSKEIVSQRGHKIPEIYPFIIEKKFETITKTKDVHNVFISLSMEKELQRAAVKKVRAGHGTMRNRKYKSRKGPLVVTSGPCTVEKACKNLPGVEVQHVDSINPELFAPGGDCGRFTIWTEGAIEILEKNNLYLR